MVFCEKEVVLRGSVINWRTLDQEVPGVSPTGFTQFGWGGKTIQSPSLAEPKQYMNM